ncbi:AEC family transporter [Temperatibacter marinus]|uniref:AEC family transporter n=1 Tax=Temperatibacter marinus TaxID=1456591 RepID=A0AA52EJL5_9PROT|nr:AEC family transporter [Temperatibacter marinus]WND03236.1 AEC family transporter [Temperatibacter marinus]
MLTNLSVMAPLFTMMALGYFLGKTTLFKQGSGAAQALSSYIWTVAIPSLLMLLIADKPFPSGQELKVVGVYYLALYTIYFLAAFVISSLAGAKKPGRAIFAFSCCFGNLGFMAIPVIDGVFGDDGLRILLMIMSFHSMTLLPITIMLSEGYSGTSASALDTFKRSLLSTMKNPVIIFLGLSLIWSATGFGLSDLVKNILALPAGSAAPVGLFAVGLTLSRVKLGGLVISAVPIMVLKLLALPALVYFFTSAVFDLPDLWVRVATVTASLPTGVLAFTVASGYECNRERVSASILGSAIASIVTLPVIISFVIN